MLADFRDTAHHDLGVLAVDGAAAVTDVSRHRVLVGDPKADLATALAAELHRMNGSGRTGKGAHDTRCACRDDPARSSDVDLDFDGEIPR